MKRKAIVIGKAADSDGQDRNSRQRVPGAAQLLATSPALSSPASILWLCLPLLPLPHNMSSLDPPLSHTHLSTPPLSDSATNGDGRIGACVFIAACSISLTGYVFRRFLSNLRSDTDPKVPQKREREVSLEPATPRAENIVRSHRHSTLATLNNADCDISTIP